MNKATERPKHYIVVSRRHEDKCLQADVARWAYIRLSNASKGLAAPDARSVVDNTDFEAMKVGESIALTACYTYDIGINAGVTKEVSCEIRRVA